MKRDASVIAVPAKNYTPWDATLDEVRWNLLEATQHLYPPTGQTNSPSGCFQTSI